MNLYFLLYLLMISLMMISKTTNSKKNIVFFFIVILAVIVGVRDKIGADYLSYVSFYNEAQSFELSNILNRATYETNFAFSFLMSLFKTFGIYSPVSFFVLISFITSYNIYRVIIRFRMRLLILPFIIYFCYFFLNHQLNTVRHGIMVSYVWLAFSYISEKNKKQFFKYILLGTLFHSLAIIFTPFFFILDRKFNKKTLTIMSVLMGVSITTPFITPIFLKVLEVIPFLDVDRILFYIDGYYAGKDITGFKVSLGIMLNIFLVAIMYKKKDFLAKQNQHFNVFFNALVISVFVAFVFSSIGVFVERISGLLNISLILVIPFLIIEFSKNVKLKVIYYILTFVYCFLVLRANAYKGDEWGHYQFIPYKMVSN